MKDLQEKKGGRGYSAPFIYIDDLCEKPKIQKYISKIKKYWDKKKFWVYAILIIIIASFLDPAGF